MPTSCANPNLPHCVVSVCLGRIIVLLSGTPAVYSAGGGWGEKWCSVFLLGPKKSHKVIFYMDREIFFFCKRMDQSVFWDLSPSLGQTVLCLWCLLCTYSPNPECFFFAIARAVSDFKPHLSTISPCCTNSFWGYLGDSLISAWPFRGWTLICLGWRENHGFLFLFAWQQPGDTQTILAFGKMWVHLWAYRQEVKPPFGSARTNMQGSTRDQGVGE